MLALAATPPAARAQQYALLDSVKTNLISAEISGDAAYDHIRILSAYHRPQGSDTLYVAAQYVERMARAFGLDSVRLIMQESKRTTWNPGTSDLWLVDERGAPVQRIASSIQNRIHLADRSRPADVTAELVDIGAGTAAELNAATVAGKIVLARGGPGDLNRVMAEAVQRRGAAGVIWYPDPYTPSRGFFSFGDQPTMVPWLTLSTQPIDGKLPTFAFILSLRGGIALHNLVAASQTPIHVHAVVHSELGSTVHPQPWMPMVEGVIRGDDPTTIQDVVLTAHMQEEQHSANDDASGCASMLEIARALTKLINDGVLPRPRREIRFWWTTENDSERRYFADHPEILKRLWVDINQDMVGADQSIDVMRTQNVNRVPFSRFHFLNDVMESVLEYMVAANSSNITQYRNGYGLYPKPYLSHNGSMHRYNAQAVWYQGDSDHEAFVDAPAGIPAVGFGNEPDRFIHSNLDDLWGIDRTQLGRNAVSAALIAYTMARADGSDLPVLAAETVGRGEGRVGRNVATALQLLAVWPDKLAAYYAAVDQLSYAAERERKGIGSLATISPRSEPLVTPLLAALDRREAEALRDLRSAYQQQANTSHEPPPRALSAPEAELARVRPVLVGGPKEFLYHRDDIVADSGVNGYLSSQLLATVDGARTGLDLYHIAAAEVREAGTQYYGVITPENVLHLLRSAEASKLFRLDRVNQ
ncbi:MAG TPA: M28 family metallopeptidase [Gemmatimonadales bacterium]|nr:M28 family metallopeptidase [Gemmatimonadales bacterium]